MESAHGGDELRERVRALLRANRVEGYSSLLGAHYRYVAPAKDRYTFQWFWDTCFHVFILCALGEIETAKNNLHTLFRMQEDDGFVGHMIFWNQILPHSPTDVVHAKLNMHSVRPHMSALIQPPLVAQALQRIYSAGKDRLFLVEMLPKVIRYHEWLASERDLDGDGLLSIISPSESGIDWKPSFDIALGITSRKKERSIFASRLFLKVAMTDTANFLRGFRARPRGNHFSVKELTVNTAYALDLSALSEMCLIAGLPELGNWYKNRADTAVASVQELMYDKATAAFYDVKTGSNEKLKVLTAMSFLPLVLPGIPEALCRSIIERHLHNRQEFLSRYPIPSVAVNDPSFYPKESFALWRGPTWPVINYFLYHGFRRKGFAAEAARLRQSLYELIEKSGFREYYDPFTGEGYGAENFTWPGLIVDMEEGEVQTDARED